MSFSKIFKSPFVKTKKTNAMTAFDSPGIKAGFAHVFKKAEAEPEIDRAEKAFFTNSAFVTRMGGVKR